MDSLFSLLYEVVGKKEFQEGLVDLLYVTAKNKEEASGKPFVKIPNSVTIIKNYTFFKSLSLTSVHIPNSVTHIGYYAFFRCTSLKSVNIPNSVTIINFGAFSRCSGLTSITIPKKFETEMDEIFYGVDLSKVKITYI